MTGQTKTLKDIKAVPPVPTKESFTRLMFDVNRPTVWRIPWGALDMIIGPNRVRRFVKRGAPIPAEAFGRVAVVKTNQEIQAQPTLNPWSRLNQKPVKAKMPRPKSPFRSQRMRGPRL